ncbi:MAG TPA: GumC family protein, partial [Acidobacteriota bacterium]|nr:GumC family protein [Acidobacteriota bacterium]
MSDIVKREAGGSLADVRRGQPTELIAGFTRGKRPAQPRHLRDHWNVILKRRWLVLAAWATVVVITAIETFTATPEYRASIRLKVDPESSNVLPYEEIRETGTNFWDAETYLQTQWAILESRTLAGRVVKRLGLDNHPVFTTPTREGFFGDIGNSLAGVVAGWRRDSPAVSREQAALSPTDSTQDDTAELVDRFLDGLRIQPVRNTRLVEVLYTCSDPVLAAQIVNTIAEEFINLHFENRYSATIRATEFLEKQLEEMKIKVEKSEERLVQYAHAHNILDLAGQENVVVQKLSDLNQEATRLEAEMIAREAEYEKIKGANVENFPRRLANEKIIGLETSEAQLAQQLASLSRRYGQRWPHLQQLQEELRQVNEQLEREKREALRQAMADYEIAVARQQRLAEALARQRVLADQLNRDSIQYN